MYNRILFYLVCISFLFTTIYGLTKEQVLKLESGYFYCKDDICASAYDSSSLDTVVFTNSEGKNTTYITETCSATDIGLDLCTSKECTADSECLSNKCLEGHCCFNEENPITECQYVRTVHNERLFGDPKGYRMQCGLPRGDKCNSNNDCSSYNCETYNNKSICGYPDDSGCRSMCGMGRLIFTFFYLPIIIAVFCCVCCCIYCTSHFEKKRNIKNLSAV